MRWRPTPARWPSGSQEIILSGDGHHGLVQQSGLAIGLAQIDGGAALAMAGERDELRFPVAPPHGHRLGEGPEAGLGRPPEDAAQQVT